MKLLKRGLFVAGALAIGYGAYYLTGKPDTMLEQTAEMVLKLHGIDVDISPEGK